MKNSLLFLLFCLSLLSCGGSQSGDETDNFTFPDEKELSAFPTTQFVATLESPLGAGMNSIYAATIPLAWDQFRTQFGGALVCDSGSLMEFILLNNSRSFMNVLQPDEYETRSEAGDDGSVTVYAAFSKALPFKYDMHSVKNGISFAGSTVEAFGIVYHDEQAVGGVTILYYEDDEHFVIQLNPKDREHKLVLAMGIDMNGTFADLLSRTHVLIDSGIVQYNNPMTSWRRAFNMDDEITIPSIQFNIHKTWSELVGQKFTGPDRAHIVVRAEQRNAFMLNEHGAAVESEDMMSADSIALINEEAHPKHLAFNQPFFLYAVRTDAVQPYFAMKIENTELMRPWKADRN